MICSARVTVALVTATLSVTPLLGCKPPPPPVSPCGRVVAPQIDPAPEEPSVEELPPERVAAVLAAAATSNAHSVVTVVAIDHDTRRPEIRTVPSVEAATTVEALTTDPDRAVVAIEPGAPLAPLAQIAPSTTAPGPGRATDPLRAQQWALDSIAFESAWPCSKGDRVTVAVIDTGVTPIADLDDRLLPGVSFTGQWGDMGADTSDWHGHGTGIASIIAAGDSNDVGMSGASPDVEVMPIQVTTPGTFAAFRPNLARAIVWAADHGVAVANLSFQVGYDTTIAAALDYAQSVGMVTVFAAGNGGPSNAAAAVGQHPNAIVIAATTPSGAVSSISSAGPVVDVAAPGHQVLMLDRAGTATAGSGTSFATAHVTAEAALLKAAYPTLGSIEVQQIITETATDIGGDGVDNRSGHGLIEPRRAVLGDAPAQPQA